MESPLYLQSRPTLQPIFDHYAQELHPRALVATGYISVDWFGVTSRFVASVWTVLQQGGNEKDVNQAVVSAALDFYDTVLKPSLVGTVGNAFLFNLLVDPFLRRAIPSMVSGLVSTLTKVMGRQPAPVVPKDTGIPSVGKTTPTVSIPAGWTPY